MVRKCGFEEVHRFSHDLFQISELNLGRSLFRDTLPIQLPTNTFDQRISRGVFPESLISDLERGGCLHASPFTNFSRNFRKIVAFNTLRRIV